MSLQAAFRKRLRKGVDTPEFERKHPFAAGTVPRPRPKTQAPKPVFGGSVGDVERQHEHTYGNLPAQSRKVSSRRGKRGGKFKQVPADNPYAGKHKNVQAAVMKAVRMVSKHKDKRGSTAHHRGAAPGAPQGDPSRGKPQNLGGGWYAHTKEVGGKPYYMVENTKTGEVDYPVFYPTGGVGYDRPEVIPSEVRAKLQRLGPPGGGHAAYRQAADKHKNTRRYVPSGQGGDLDVQDPREEGV
ncbi:hypothetical protein LCGC14_2075340 [marine sediment metagenome]|uniref:Uncharacterized protein n=1 Tax=marine sediment metagenome TaxID=412755 RepID=A0A0F9HE90_9ZZZZ